MKRVIKLTESDIHDMVRSAINEISGNELDGFSATELRNMLGDYDDDELNAAVQSEDNEYFKDEVTKVLQKLCKSQNIYARLAYFFFPEVQDALEGEFNLKYEGHENEGYVFDNGNFELIIYPVTFYETPGDFRIKNIQVFTSTNESKSRNKKTIKITESDIHKIVSETVKRLLPEAYQDKYEHATDALDFYANKVHDGHVLSNDQLQHIQEIYDFLKDTNANDNYELMTYWLPMAKNLLNGRNSEESIDSIRGWE